MKRLLFLCVLFCSSYSFSQVTHTVPVTIDSNQNCGTLGLEDVNQRFFATYPNPARGFIVIKSKTQQEILGVSIYNLIGKEVKKESFPTTLSEIKINTENLNDGIYILQIKTVSSHYSRKIIIKNE